MTQVQERFLQAWALVPATACFVVWLAGFYPVGPNMAWVFLVMGFLILAVASILTKHKWQALPAVLAAGAAAVLEWGYFLSDESWPFILVMGATVLGIATMWLTAVYGHSLGILFTDFNSSKRRG